MKPGNSEPDDPRPFKYRKESGYDYNSFVRNSVFAFCHQEGKNIPMRNNYTKASLDIATKDHDYLKCQQFTEHWVNRATEVVYSMLI